MPLPRNPQKVKARPRTSPAVSFPPVDWCNRIQLETCVLSISHVVKGHSYTDPNSPKIRHIIALYFLCFPCMHSMSATHMTTIHCSPHPPPPPLPWKCINLIPCTSKILLLGRQTQQNKAVVNHVSQCFSNVTLIMKNICTFPPCTFAEAQILFPTPSGEEAHQIIIVFNALVIIPGFMMVF